MPDRGLSARIAKKEALDRVFAAGDAVAKAKEERARAREALRLAEETVLRAVYRHCAERVALEVVNRGGGGFGSQ